MARLENVKVNLKLPGVASIEGTWRPGKAECEAAWEMYIELITRVPIAPIHPEEGLLREALSSLHTLFDTTRSILRNYGPQVAKPRRGDQISFGYLAIAVLNTAVRPLLSKWHPLLQSYESTRQPDVSPAEHERNWECAADLRQSLNDTRKVLVSYADILGKVACVPSLVYDEASS